MSDESDRTRGDEELGAVAAELAGTLADLRAELDEERRRDRPSRVTDLLRFTERYTIPTIVAILEANIRLLELLAGGLRLATGDLDREDGRGRRGRSRTAGTASAGADLLARTGERTATATLSALDRALTDAAAALEGSDPPDPEARRLLREARRLRADLDERLREAGERADDEDDEDDAGDPGDATTVPVDVEAELRSIRDEVEGRSTAADDDADRTGDDG
jgi:hypothetical protein